VAATEFNEYFVPKEDKAIMPIFEAEVRLISEFKDDEVVEFQVGE
jgi:hypothetical protein